MQVRTPLLNRISPEHGVVKWFKIGPQREVGFPVGLGRRIFMQQSQQQGHPTRRALQRGFLCGGYGGKKSQTEVKTSMMQKNTQTESCHLSQAGQRPRLFPGGEVLISGWWIRLPPHRCLPLPASHTQPLFPLYSHTPTGKEICPEMVGHYGERQEPIISNKGNILHKLMFNNKNRNTQSKGSLRQHFKGPLCPKPQVPLFPHLKCFSSIQIFFFKSCNSIYNIHITT